jgi:Uma2 family endonuclease
MEQPVQVDPNRRYTVEEYFQIEAASDERYEYVDGRIFPVGEPLAMSGGSLKHSFIGSNATRLLGNLLVGTPCRVFNSDLRIRIGRKLKYAYPDVGIVCGEPQMEDAPAIGQTLLNPRVVVEVLSPSTEKRDRGEKFEAYREIDSLEEYILISQDAPRVESFLRQADGTWSLMPTLGLDAIARVRCLKIDLPLRELYAGVELQVPDASEPGSV